MKKQEIAFEESLADAWEDCGRDVAEVSLDEKPLFQVGVAMTILGAIIMIQIFYLNIIRDGFYGPRAEANMGHEETIPAPRGIITDRFGISIAENRAVFSALLDVRTFLKHKEYQEDTLKTITRIFGISNDEIWNLIEAYDLERSADPIVLAADIAPAEVVSVREAKLPTLKTADTFARTYPQGEIFSSILGFVGLPNKQDLKDDASLTGREQIGKTGLESYYDSSLRGLSGMRINLRDARGEALGDQEKRVSRIGETLKLSVDAEFQEYFYSRFKRGLEDLGRTTGVGIAINPKNGEILSLFSFPSYDNNAFVVWDRSDERSVLLNDSSKPLFNRAVGGVYSPGSTIKPLVGVAALAEGVVSAETSVFSPGYLDVPNPYDPSNPTRFEDWRYQGDVNLSAALAQSSNVYFYTVGGGANGIKGLGIERLKKWWGKFLLDKKTGIDLPGESVGFLPSAEWKEKVTGVPWFLGDTYNVSIGQGDLQITPIQLLNYIGAVANGGIFYKPRLKIENNVEVLSSISDEADIFIEKVREGMRATVSMPLGTAYTMNDLSFAVSGKTGSAQIKNNMEENAFFVGYAPSEDPEIAILVLVENAKAGSLNAVPIAKDALNWYYEHRIKK